MMHKEVKAIKWRPSESIEGQLLLRSISYIGISLLLQADLI